MHIITNARIPSLHKQAHEALNRFFEQFKLHQILFLTSGGSALNLLTGITKDNLGAHVTISVVDERYSLDPTINNFAQLMETKFYTLAADQGCHFIPTILRPGESISELAARWENGLKVWIHNHPDRIIVTTLGVGEDGHIGGIFPYPEDPARFSQLFDQPDHWVVGYNAQNKHEHPLRVTLTLPFMRQFVDYAVLLAQGKNKLPALERVVAPEGTLAETPARIVQSMQHVDVFTDNPELSHDTLAATSTPTLPPSA